MRRHELVSPTAPHKGRIEDCRRGIARLQSIRDVIIISRWWRRCWGRFGCIWGYRWGWGRSWRCRFDFGLGWSWRCAAGACCGFAWEDAGRAHVRLGEGWCHLGRACSGLVDLRQPPVGAFKGDWIVQLQQVDAFATPFRVWPIASTLVVDSADDGVVRIKQLQDFIVCSWFVGQ